MPTLLQGPAGRHGGRHSSHDQHALVRKSFNCLENDNHLFLDDEVFDASEVFRVSSKRSKSTTVQLIFIVFFSVVD